MCVLRLSCVFCGLQIRDWWQPFLSGYYMLTASPTTRLTATGGRDRGQARKKKTHWSWITPFLHCKYDAVGFFQALGSLLIDFASVCLTPIFIQSGLNFLRFLPIRCDAFSSYAVFMSRYWPFHIWNTERNIPFQKQPSQELSKVNICLESSVISVKIETVKPGISEDFFPHWSEN